MITYILFSALVAINLTGLSLVLTLWYLDERDRKLANNLTK
jgi:hypothetical protein